MQAKVLEATFHAIQRCFLLGIDAGALAVILAIFMDRGAIDLNHEQALNDLRRLRPKSRCKGTRRKALKETKLKILMVLFCLLIVSHWPVVKLF